MSFQEKSKGKDQVDQVYSQSMEQVTSESIPHNYICSKDVVYDRDKEDKSDLGFSISHIVNSNHQQSVNRTSDAHPDTAKKSTGFNH